MEIQFQQNRDFNQLHRKKSSMLGVVKWENGYPEQWEDPLNDRLTKEKEVGESTKQPAPRTAETGTQNSVPKR